VALGALARRDCRIRSDFAGSGDDVRIYIAAHSQQRANALKLTLEEHGHCVVSRWVIEDAKFGDASRTYSDTERQELALMDENDTRAADALVLIAEREGVMVPGGKHVETGIALALRKPVYVIGRRENVFHWHPLVTLVSTTSELVALLATGRGALAGR
jgi:hypothetical protein